MPLKMVLFFSFSFQLFQYFMLNFISSSFFVYSLFFSRDDHIVSVHFISFCCLISLPRYSNIILNRNSNRKYLCPFQILRGRILVTYYWISCLCMKESWIIGHERLWGASIKMIYTLMLGILHLCSLVNLTWTFS